MPPVTVLVTSPLWLAFVSPDSEIVTVTPVPPVVASACPVWLLSSGKTSQLSRPVVILQPEAAIAGAATASETTGMLQAAPRVTARRPTCLGSLGRWSKRLVMIPPQLSAPGDAPVTPRLTPVSHAELYRRAWTQQDGIAQSVVKTVGLLRRGATSGVQQRRRAQG